MNKILIIFMVLVLSFNNVIIAQDAGMITKNDTILIDNAEYINSLHTEIKNNDKFCDGYVDRLLLIFTILYVIILILILKIYRRYIFKKYNIYRYKKASEEQK